MSQRKVDAYKKEKRNRKKDMKKARIRKNEFVVIIFVIILALCAWFAYLIHEGKNLKGSSSSAPGSFVIADSDGTTYHLSQGEDGNYYLEMGDSDSTEAESAESASSEYVPDTTSDQAASATEESSQPE